MIRRARLAIGSHGVKGDSVDDTLSSFGISAVNSAGVTIAAADSAACVALRSGDRLIKDGSGVCMKYPDY